MFGIRFRAISVTFILALLLAPVVTAQRFSWPEKPENLQVLPSDWPGSRLSPVMRGFTRALGVRCSYCHVGEEGESLATYDFASDDNPNKIRAREMLRLLGSVNDHLQNIEPSGDKPVNMWCHTCHRGRPRPMTLAEELGEKYRGTGVDEALALYKELKEEYYGKGAYNFGEEGLNEFGYEVLAAGDTEGAIRVFSLNSEIFPESAGVWDSLAEGYMEAGNKAVAIHFYTKSLEIEPRNQNARSKLEDLQE